MHGENRRDSAYKDASLNIVFSTGFSGAPSESSSFFCSWTTEPCFSGEASLPRWVGAEGGGGKYVVILTFCATVRCNLVTSRFLEAGSVSLNGPERLTGVCRFV